MSSHSSNHLDSTVYTWTALISLLILYSFILTFVTLIQNHERGTQGEKNEEPFSLLQCCWFFSLISIQLGAERTPISKSGKILIISWSCFTVIVLATYTANLAAFFTNPTPGRPLCSINNILDSTKYDAFTCKDNRIYFESHKKHILKTLTRVGRVIFDVKITKVTYKEISQIKKALENDLTWRALKGTYPHRTF